VAELRVQFALKEVSFVLRISTPENLPGKELQNVFRLGSCSRDNMAVCALVVKTAKLFFSFLLLTTSFVFVFVND